MQRATVARDAAASAAVSQLQQQLNTAQTATSSQQQQLATQPAALQHAMAAPPAPTATPATTASMENLSLTTLIAFAKVIADVWAPTASDDFSVDVMTWSPLRERYSSRLAVQDRQYEALHVVPSMEKPLDLELTHLAFHSLFSIVYLRWDSPDSLKDPTTLTW